MPKRLHNFNPLHLIRKSSLTQLTWLTGLVGVCSSIACYEDAENIEQSSMLVSGIDFTVAEITRNRTLARYELTVCNQGDTLGNMSVRLRDRATSEWHPVEEGATVPGPAGGQCQTLTLSCRTVRVDNPQCTNAINLRAEVQNGSDVRPQNDVLDIDLPNFGG